MGKGKILMMMGLLVIIGSLGYYFINNQEQNKKLVKKIEAASQEYFKKYVRTNETASAYEITLKELIDANNNGENYDLKGLENCDKNKTYATISINMSNGKVTKTEVKLKCK